jgi:hypothetical protein
VTFLKPAQLSASSLVPFDRRRSLCQQLTQLLIGSPKFRQIFRDVTKWSVCCSGVDRCPLVNLVSQFKAFYEKRADLVSRIRAVDVLNKQCDDAAALIEKCI